jgi:hypothetical protein
MRKEDTYPLAPFVYNDIELSETVLIDGIPHVTRRAVGELLEYNDPQNGVDSILSRNNYIEDHSLSDCQVLMAKFANILSMTPSAFY